MYMNISFLHKGSVSGSRLVCVLLWP